MSLLSRYDVSIDVLRKSSNRNVDLCSDFRFGETQHYNLPFRNIPPEVPNNYIDFMRLYYVKLNQNKVDEIILFNERLNYSKLRSLSYKFGGKGYDDFLLSRMGLKYFVFYRYHGYDNLKKIFVNFEYPVKEYKRSSENIENMLLDLQYKVETGKDSLGTLLIEDHNSIVKNLLIESLKMEEIMDNYNSKSNISRRYNDHHCNMPTDCNSNDKNHECDNTPFFGGKDSVYKCLMDILNRIDYSLQYPKVPEGIVTYDHLLSELAKYKGVDRPTLDVILGDYVTVTDLVVKLGKYLTKEELNDVIKTLATKIELEEYAKVQDVKDNYFNKLVVLEKFDNVYTKEQIEEIVANLVTEDRLDVRLERYLATEALKDIIENYITIDDASKSFVSRNEANELYAKASDIVDFNDKIIDIETNYKIKDTELEEKIAALSQKGYDDTEIQGKVNDLQTKSNELEGKITAEGVLRADKDKDIDEKIVNLTNKDGELENKITASNLSIEAIKTELTEKTAKITRLEEEVAEIKKILGNIKGIKVVSKDEADTLVPEDGVLYLFEK